jgi:hypothetical protein
MCWTIYYKSERFYSCKWINPFLVSTFNITVFQSFRIMSTLAFRKYTAISSWTIQIRWTNFPLNTIIHPSTPYFILWLKSSCTSSSSCIHIPRPAHFLIIFLICVSRRSDVSHVSQQQWVNNGAFRCREHCHASTVSRNCGFEDTETITTTLCIGRTTLTRLLLTNTTTTLVAVHTEITLGIVVASVVELNSCTNATVLTTMNIKRLRGNWR